MSDLIQVYADTIFEPAKPGPAITTVGTFDGVHLGHRKILQHLHGDGSERLLKTVVTFEPHPQNVMRRRPGLVPIISGIQQKIRLLRAADVDRIFILRFTEELAGLSAEAFLTRILLDRLETKKLVVGYNHAFGAGRSGTIEYLNGVKEQFGFDLDVVGPYFIDAENVSSSKIRLALEDGDIGKAHRFLGRPYCLSGKVVPGDGRGRKLRFPTANLEPVPANRVIPKIGVYAVAVEHEQRVYPGMMNIGTRPTFGSGAMTVEVHLSNFTGDLYGETINLQILKRLRDETRFDSVQDLIDQLAVDHENCLQVFRSQDDAIIQPHRFC
jgi:riboflavin kinase/FMN adenylyltransferase